MRHEQRGPLSPDERVDSWRAGKIEDTPDNTRITIWALALRDAVADEVAARLAHAQAVV